MAEKQKMVTGTTFDAIGKLEEVERIVKSQVESIPEGNSVRYRCDALLLLFSDQLVDIKKLAPTIEQLKGMAKGLEMSSPIAQHIGDAYKTEMKDGDTEKLKLVLQVIQRTRTLLEDAGRRQRSELEKTIGKMEGMVNSAMGTLRGVEAYLASYKQKKITEQELLAEDETDSLLEQHSLKLVGKEQVQAKPKRARTRTKKSKSNSVEKTNESVS